jgi:predicted RNA-binding protein with RPS1 domain
VLNTLGILQEGTGNRGRCFARRLENEKFSLGIKQIERNPWEELAQRFAMGTVVSGKVTNLTDFGIFVEIEEGIEGLVHISELSQRRVKSPSELFAVGDVISAVVKSVDSKNRKIRLSVKDYEASVVRQPLHEHISTTGRTTIQSGEGMANAKTARSGAMNSRRQSLSNDRRHPILLACFCLVAERCFRSRLLYARQRAGGNAPYPGRQGRVVRLTA